MSPGILSRPDASEFGIIIVAGGSGQRLGYGLPKAQVPLAGEPILAHALRGAIASDVAGEIVVVLPRDNETLHQVCAAAPEAAHVRTVIGGSSRAESVRAGLTALRSGTQFVLVHDAARALTPPDVFRRVAHALHQGAEAVIPAIPAVDTMKTVAGTTAEQADLAPEIVVATPERSRLRAVQTPQGFTAATLRAAHRATELFDESQHAAVTDDAMLVETLGTPVYVVTGSVRALKITTPLDLTLAEALIAAEAPHRIVEG